MLDALLQDIRYSLRVLRHSPGFSLIVLVTLALAIGANTALFSLFNAIVLRPLAVRDPQRLVVLTATDGKGGPLQFMYGSTFSEFLAQQRAFDAASMYSGGGLLRVEARGFSVDAGVEGASPSYFDMLGVRPVVGRLFTESDAPTVSEGAPVVVLGYRFWQRQFAGDPHVIGETLKVQATPLTIIGVTQPGFHGLQADGGADFFVPIATLRPLAGDSNRPVRARNAIARLKPGVTLDQARADVAARWSAIVMASLPQGLTPAERDQMQSQRIGVESIATGFSDLRRQYADPMVVLVGLTALLLAIGCANLSGLSLARAIGRERQLAIRLALGASRGRLVQQALAESMLLSVAGALVALPLAWWVSRLLGATLWTGASDRLAMSMTPDARVMTLAAAVAVGTGLVVGVLPAWLAAGGRTRLALRSAGGVSASMGRSGRVLLIAQVALSLVLLVGAGLFARSLSRLQANDSTFPTRQIVWTRLWLKPGDRGADLGRSYFFELAGQLARIPGAESVGFSTVFPAFFNFPLPPETFARDETTGGPHGVTGLSEVISPRFFETVGIARLQGRDFTWDDDVKSPPVAIVNATCARELFAGASAIGQRVRMSRDPQHRSIEIVGIVDDAPIGNIREPHVAVLFRPMLQEPQRARVPNAHVRAAGPVQPVREAYGRVVSSLGRHFVRNVYTLDEQVDTSLLQERLVAWLSSFFAGLAVLLASVGLYGLLGYAVARRTREIGIRMALGATPGSVLSMIVREGLWLAALGVGVGVPCALAAGRFTRSLLYGLSPNDPSTLAGAAALFILVAAIAGAIPAYRASTIDPMTALRQD